MGGRNKNRQNSYRPNGNRQNVKWNLIRQNIARQAAGSGQEPGGQGPLLSISILASGREDTTKKCIDSLDKLRQRVSCELIVTDTGCSPQLHNWLAEKADKVLYFVWCDDFAAARNKGLLASTGKWFMFMDDDEWFEDTSEIEEFFLSGEYLQYESAHYVVRNYVDYEGSRWSDTSIARMVRRLPETRYRYPIHEILFPILSPSKILGDYVHHYGYVITDIQMQKRKTERNLSLLKPAMEKDPGCIHYWLQAAGEYAYWDRWEEAAETAEQGLRNYDPHREDNANFVQGLYEAVVQLRIRWAFGCEDLEKADEIYGIALRRGEEMLSSGRLCRLGEVCVSGDLTIACGALGRDQECIDHAAKYLEGKAYFEENTIEYNLQQTLFLSNTFELYRYLRVLCWSLSAYLRRGQGEEAERLLAREDMDWWMEILPVWYKEAHEEHRKDWGLALERLAQENRDSRIGVLFEALMKRGEAVEEAERNAADSRSGGTGGEEGTVRGDGGSLSPAPASEMEALAVQLKEKIRFLLQQGMREEARNTILQLQKFFPEDQELIQWMKELEA